MYRYALVIYPTLRVVAHSMIIYLQPPDKKGGRICVGATLVNGFTYICLCVNTTRNRLREGRCAIYMPIFIFIFIFYFYFNFYLIREVYA